MTTFAERLAELPEWPVRLAGTSTAGLTFLRADALEARLRLAVELLEEVANSRAGGAIFWGKADTIPEIQAYQDLRTRFGLRDDARALLAKVKGGMT